MRLLKISLIASLMLVMSVVVVQDTNGDSNTVVAEYVEPDVRDDKATIIQ